MEQMEFGPSLCDEASVAMQEQYGFRRFGEAASFQPHSQSGL
ncbi:hypothetical protein [Planococcus halotolerans]|nr:hypothetical protein [Planococcus halotolerans]